MIPGKLAKVRTGARVLIVEDNTDSAESMAILLALYGHEVQVASDGPQALAAVQGWRPEFILMDLGLPAMNGYELAIRLRQEASCRESVLVAVTGYGLPDDRRRSRVSGIDHHLVKPVDPEVLLSLLSRSETVPDADEGSSGDLLAALPAMVAAPGGD